MVDVRIYFRDTLMSAENVVLTENMTSIEIYDFWDGSRSVVPLASILYYEVTPSDQ